MTNAPGDGGGEGGVESRLELTGPLFADFASSIKIKYSPVKMILIKNC